MQKVHVVATLTSATALLAIVVSLVYIPVLYSKMTIIRSELKVDMDEFKVHITLQVNRNFKLHFRIYPIASMTSWPSCLVTTEFVVNCPMVNSTSITSPHLQLNVNVNNKVVVHLVQPVEKALLVTMEWPDHLVHLERRVKLDWH